MLSRNGRTRPLLGTVALAIGAPLALSAGAAPASATVVHVETGFYRGTTSPVLEPLGNTTVRVKMPFQFVVQLKPSDECGGPKKARAVVDCMQFLSPIGTYGTVGVVATPHACSSGAHIGVLGAPWAPLLEVPASGVVDARTLVRDRQNQPWGLVSAHLVFRSGGTFSGSFTDVAEVAVGSGKYVPRCSVGAVRLSARRVSAKA
ncbi:MAG: hypothetical protein M0Z33_06230 [Actinomycetota bacterium]|nr:hypothetical protein [Actinomycetota bacterium]